MPSPIRKFSLVLVCGMLLGVVGCGEMLHNMKLHRLQRLNRNPPIGDGAMYSVSDPIERQDTAAPITLESE